MTLPTVLVGFASFAALGFAALGGLGGGQGSGPKAIGPNDPGNPTPGLPLTLKGPARKDKLVLSEAEWRKRLTPEQFDILRKEGTEPRFCSPLLDVHQKGVFHCVGCDNPLFSTDAKFESGTGWPSFFKPITKDAVWYRLDTTYGRRTEILCAKCDGHLGHVFDDGPRDKTGWRFCMNGGVLKFVPDKK